MKFMSACYVMGHWSDHLNLHYFSVQLCSSQGSPEQCSQMRLLLDDVFSEVRSDLSCVFNSELNEDQGRVTSPRNAEGVTLQLQSDGIVALLERYSEILARIAASKANSV